MSIFSVKKHSILSEQIGEHNISFLLQKKLSFCALCCWGLCFGFAICCWIFKNKTNLCTPSYHKKLFSCSLLYFSSKERICVYLLKNSSLLLFNLFFFASFIDSCPFCGRSDTDIGCGSSVASSRLISFLFHFISLFPRFLFFTFLWLCVFRCFFFDVLLYSFFSPYFHLFWSSLRVSNFFVFPLFDKIFSCFISSFSICSCSDSFSMSSSFSHQKLVTPFVGLFFSILLFCFFFFRIFFLRFSFCPLVCSLFSVVYIVFRYMFSYFKCPFL